MAFRFPGGASSEEAFWKLLVEGQDAITEIPADRWDAARFYDPDLRAKGKMHTKWGGFVEDIAHFDAEFFGISPKEAESMDPQQRLLLELAWEALENAGTSRAALTGSATGVFVGIMNNNEYQRRKRVDERPENVAPHTSTGDAISIAAGRLSYFFGLHGPALAVDTACSSSLVALHLAASSLRSGECDTALVAGVNLIAHPTTALSFAKTRMLSPTGRCKTFDASADGYVRGEGGAVLVVKPLSKALAARDRILAVVRGTAVNQDGRGSGLTAPNGKAQQALIRRALADAGVAPGDISYVEAHGTGTPLGDPIEVDSLLQVFAPSRDVTNPLVVGAVKANIGHLEACAGLAGVVKVILGMKHEELPRQVHLARQNPRLVVPDWMVLPRENRPWRAEAGRKRLAGVSSFGFSGTNAHVVLEEPPSGAEAPTAERSPVVLCLSASTPEALREVARRYAASGVFAQGPAELTNVAASAARREHLPVRAALVADALPALREQLTALGDGAPRPGTFGPEQALEAPVTAFLYSGDAEVYPELGRELYRTEPVFRAAIDECSRVIGPRLEVPLAAVLSGARGELLAQPRYAQAAQLAVQVGLTALWRDLGLAPECVVGQGLGEYGAAVAAGILDVSAACALLLGPGPEAGGITFQRPQLRFISGLTGQPVAEEACEASYWARVPREPGLLPEALRAAVASGCNVLVQLGPGEALLHAARAAVGPSAPPLRLLASLQKERGEAELLAETLAGIYATGLNVRWERFYCARASRYHPLPPYPFSRRPYWVRDSASTTEMS
jgi:acyl transferase domain-containing protein